MDQSVSHRELPAADDQQEENNNVEQCLCYIIWIVDLIGWSYPMKYPITIDGLFIITPCPKLFETAWGHPRSSREWLPLSFCVTNRLAHQVSRHFVLGEMLTSIVSWMLIHNMVQKRDLCLRSWDLRQGGSQRVKRAVWKLTGDLVPHLISNFTILHWMMIYALCHVNKCFNSSKHYCHVFIIGWKHDKYFSRLVVRLMFHLSAISTFCDPQYPVRMMLNPLRSAPLPLCPRFHSHKRALPPPPCVRYILCDLSERWLMKNEKERALMCASERKRTA